jgi:Uncharacterized conserved protein
MARAFETQRGELVDKLLAAVEAGEKAGGDRRGKLSAAVLVFRPNGGYLGLSDVYVDIRVDDHPEPVAELRRVFKIWELALLQRETPATRWLRKTSRRRFSPYLGDSASTEAT